MLDFGDVVVHVMSAEKREYYDLEGFYGAAEEVKLISMQGILRAANACSLCLASGCSCFSGNPKTSWATVISMMSTVACHRLLLYLALHTTRSYMFLL